MIEILFQFVNELILVKIVGNSVLFGNTNYGAQMAPIEGLKLDKSGVLKEFPDLSGDADWRKKAISRFKEKIKSYPTERMKADYIIDDLKKFGYIPTKIQISGRRPQSL